MVGEYNEQEEVPSELWEERPAWDESHPLHGIEPRPVSGPSYRQLVGEAWANYLSTDRDPGEDIGDTATTGLYHNTVVPPIITLTEEGRRSLECFFKEDKVENWKQEMER